MPFRLGEERGDLGSDPRWVGSRRAAESLAARFFAHLQRNQHADRLVSSRLAWSFYGLHQTQSDLLTSDTLSAFAAKFDLDSDGGDGDALHQELNIPGLFSRE
jgi:hypothetical protein